MSFPAVNCFFSSSVTPIEAPILMIDSPGLFSSRSSRKLVSDPLSTGDRTKDKFAENGPVGTYGITCVERELEKKPSMYQRQGITEN
jgi:hypothetical protein